MTKRCANPHPSIPGRPCNAKLVAREGIGQVVMECPKCFGPIVFDFLEENTEAKYIPIS